MDTLSRLSSAKESSPKLRWLRASVWKASPHSGANCVALLAYCTRRHSHTVRPASAALHYRQQADLDGIEVLVHRHGRLRHELEQRGVVRRGRQRLLPPCHGRPELAFIPSASGSAVSPATFVTSATANAPASARTLPSCCSRFTLTAASSSNSMRLAAGITTSEAPASSAPPVKGRPWAPPCRGAAAAAAALRFLPLSWNRTGGVVMIDNAEGTQVSGSVIRNP